MGLAWLDRKRARRGWVGLVSAGVMTAGVLGFDTFSLQDETLVLPGRDWTLSSGDLPRSWTHLEQSDSIRRVFAKAPEVRGRSNVWMRKTTGLRWTPSRWNLWFGRVVSVSGQGDAAVACVRAQLIPRTAFAIANGLGLVESREGVARVFGWNVARFGRFFLIGTSPEIVERLRSSGEHWSSMGGSGVSFDRAGDRSFSMYVDAEREISTSLWLDKIEHRVPARAEYFSIDWPDAPIVSVVSRGVDFDSLVLDDDWPEFPGSAELAKTWNDFETLLPEGWRAGADTTQFALFDVDMSEGIPVLDAAVYSRSETLLAPLMRPPNAIAYEWSGTPGWITPWMGEGANLFVVADDRARVFTNQETTMAKLMARRRAGRIASDDARIEIDAERLAAVLADLVRRAAKEELVLERNADDVEQDIIPWINAFGAFGEIRLEGKYENGGLSLRGGTRALPAEKAP